MNTQAVAESITWLDADRLYSSMFPDNPNTRYQCLLMIAVYNMIAKNSGITFNKLQWRLNAELSLSKRDVEIAVNALTSIFNAVSKYHVNSRNKRSKYEIVHLRMRNPENQILIEQWIENVLEEYPEFAKIN